MNILILGGTGLISTAISREFLKRSSVNLTLYNRGQRESRIPDGAAVINGDRNDIAAFEAQMAEAGTWDCVIDMICFTPEQAHSTARAFKGRTGHLIFCSTVDVYSKPASRYPIVESESRGGLSAYAANKILCEDILFEAHHRGDFPLTIIRPAMTYGEGGMLLDAFGRTTRQIDRMRKGKPIIVHGDGQTLWTACHIDDEAHAFVYGAGRAHTFGKTYHATGEEWLTWDRYYNELAAAIGAPPPKLVHIPTDLLVKLDPVGASRLRENFFGNNIFDNSAARNDLDFRYSVPWREGARRTVAWLDEHGKIEDSDQPPSDQRPHEDIILDAWEKLSAGMLDATAALREKN